MAINDQGGFQQFAPEVAVSTPQAASEKSGVQSLADLGGAARSFQNAREADAKIEAEKVKLEASHAKDQALAEATILTSQLSMEPHLRKALEAGQLDQSAVDAALSGDVSTLRSALAQTEAQGMSGDIRSAILRQVKFSQMVAKFPGHHKEFASQLGIDISDTVSLDELAAAEREAETAALADARKEATKKLISYGVPADQIGPDSLRTLQTHPLYEVEAEVERGKVMLSQLEQQGEISDTVGKNAARVALPLMAADLNQHIRDLHAEVLRSGADPAEVGLPVTEQQLLADLRVRALDYANGNPQVAEDMMKQLSPLVTQISTGATAADALRVSNYNANQGLRHREWSAQRDRNQEARAAENHGLTVTQLQQETVQRRISIEEGLIELDTIRRNRASSVPEGFEDRFGDISYAAAQIEYGAMDPLAAVDRMINGSQSTNPDYTPSEKELSDASARAVELVRILADPQAAQLSPEAMQQMLAAVPQVVAQLPDKQRRATGREMLNLLETSPELAAQAKKSPAIRELLKPAAEAMQTDIAAVLLRVDRAMAKDKVSAVGRGTKGFNRLLLWQNLAQHVQIDPDALANGEVKFRVKSGTGTKVSAEMLDAIEEHVIEYNAGLVVLSGRFQAYADLTGLDDPAKAMQQVMVDNRRIQNLDPEAEAAAGVASGAFDFFNNVVESILPGAGEGTAAENPAPEAPAPNTPADFSGPADKPSTYERRIMDAEGSIGYQQRVSKSYRNGKFYPYKDTEGYWTIGYGHKISDDKTEEPPEGFEEGWGYKEALANFREDLSVAEREMDEVLKDKGITDIPAPTRELLNEMAFNLGAFNFAGWPKFWAAMQERDWDRAADELVDSKWYGQVKRRGARIVTAFEDSLKGVA